METDTPPSPTSPTPSAVAMKALKTFLIDMDLTITKEFDDKDMCGFWIEYGNFPILIENRKPMKFFLVALQVTFSDEPIIQALNAYYEKQDHGFIFRLTRAFTTPISGFTRVIESGRVIGFTVMKSIYPFHPGFTITDFDRALQTVASTGDIGVAFLKSEMGPAVFDHTPPRPASEPGPMYE